MSRQGAKRQAEWRAYSRRLPPAMPVVLPICRRLRMAEIVDQFCPMRERKDSALTHGQVVEFVVLHLLQSPHRQPLYKLAEWAERHQVGLIYGCEPEAFNDDRVGRTLDALAPVIEAIEARVVSQALVSYRVDVRAIHWDLTHMTFSGAYENCPRVQGGYGGGALHERQMKLSLHMTSDGGVPVRHQVLPGGAHQAPFAAQMLAVLQEQLGRSDLIVVSDSAGISYENIEAYQKARAHFLAPLQLTEAERRQLLSVPLEEFTELTYRARSAPEDPYYAYDTTLELRRQKHSAPLPVRALFIYSTRKARQDAEKRQQLLDRTLKRLAQIQGYLVTQPRYRRIEFARTQIEKAIPESLQPVVRYELIDGDPPFTLRFSIDQKAWADTARSDGRYLLVLDLEVEELSPDQAFALYKQQPLIERRFRGFHSDLQIKPLWLHNETRILALVLVFILALLVYTLLERRSERVGLSTPYYHKMTARELILAFDVLDLLELHIRGSPPTYQLHLSYDQQKLLNRLGFPDPLTYLT